jgi:quinoprotein glucose dehydrogenase
VDAATGELCTDFGQGGTVRLDVGVGNVQEGQYGITSPPVIVGDVVVLGSSMGDNRRVDMERGIVRGYDARTGELLWSWDPIPRDSSDPMYETWSAEAAAVTGGGNAWAPLSADEERDLVFVPTGSAAPDFYGGQRPGDNRYANSVVALRASTGEVVWHFQVVHHDVWDYDVPAQPTLTTVTRDGVDVPAVVVGTKQGFLFVLHRETGAPLFPVEERTVPPSSIPGEVLSSTQPFPVLPEPLHPFGFSSDDVFGLTEEDRAVCRESVASLDWDGMYTPPSFKGNLMYPGYGGGINWGGVAIDEGRRWAVTNVMRLPFWVRLQKRTSPDRGNQIGTPYQMVRAMLMGPSGLPCSPPPWSTLIAVDLDTGEKRWEVPLGVVPALVEAGLPDADRLGSPAMGGPMVTAGGLVFIGAAMDDYLRAYDVETGEEVWKAALPAGGQATPMTYLHEGKQYIVIAAGGHGSLGTTRGDYVVAFAVPGGTSR